MWKRNPLRKNIFFFPPILVTLPSTKPFNALVCEICRVDLCDACSLRFDLSLQHFPILPQAYISCAWRWNTSSVHHRTGSELTQTNSVRWHLSNMTDILAGVESPLNSCIKQMRAEELVFKKSWSQVWKRSCSDVCVRVLQVSASRTSARILHPDLNDKSVCSSVHLYVRVCVCVYMCNMTLLFLPGDKHPPVSVSSNTAKTTHNDKACTWGVRSGLYIDRAEEACANNNNNN